MVKKNKGKETNVLSTVTGGVWNFFMMNNRNTQNAFRTYIVVIFLVLAILIAFQAIDFNTKSHYDTLRKRAAARDRVHNIEMTIGKEYIRKTSEEYIVDEVVRRGLPLEESVKPPKRIYYE